MISIPASTDVRLALAALAAAALLAVTAPRSHASFPGRDGAIVYVWYDHLISNIEPHEPIYDAVEIRAAPASGGAPTTLRGCVRQEGRADVGDCSLSYGSPTVSPNGRRIVFDAGASLALMRIDGRGFRLLPRHSADDGSPSFSPDGRRLAFTVPARRPTRLEPLDVWVAGVDGSRARRIAAGTRAPDWSVRGWIALLRHDGIYRVRPDGHGLRRVLRRRGCSDVAWSPNGTRLALACRGRLLITDGSGRHLRVLPVGTTSAAAVAWSPSGKQLAIGLEEGSLSTFRLDGRAGTEIESGGFSSQGTVGASAPDWQPLR